MKIILINVFFGPYPLWFPAFLLSCRYNPTVDWLLITDNIIPNNFPDNIQFLQVSLKDFLKLASDKLKLSIDISPKNVFKLIDLKIGYGKIFKDYASSYDFWGICDIDIIWGNIRKYMNEKVLKNYDIISSRRKKISGHFTLFRNDKQLLKFLLGLPKFKQLVEAENIYITDERYLTSYIKDISKSNIFNLNRITIGKNLEAKIYWKKYLTLRGKDQKNISDNTHDAFIWELGRTFNRKKQELMYLHFHLLKKTISEINFSYEDEPKKLILTPSKIWAIK